MNIIGTFPRAKGWVVHYNALTGGVYGDYDEPIGLSEEKTAERAARAAALIAAQPVCPEITLPRPSINWSKATAEERAAYDAWKEQQDAVFYWQKASEEQHWRTYNAFAPVFREVATFVGYTRGRSSVTMKFRFADGSTLEIGPSGIDKFITGIQDGHIIRKNGGFDLTFRMEKKGANVYMWPMYTEEDFKGMAPYEAADA